ncbi:MAG: histidine phosphatase family protein, partial [Paludibacteraceae bacterium]|nr:histidine phosphatase family protein [Paludibacteraceae bacterium]
MTKIYLCRHGETEWNVVKRMQGQNNSNLTELGVSQAKALGKRLEDIDIDIIYSSSCQRALDTAMHARGNRDLQIIAEDDLREINLGNWEGLLFSEAEER